MEYHKRKEVKNKYWDVVIKSERSRQSASYYMQTAFEKYEMGLHCEVIFWAHFEYSARIVDDNM